jgi:uridine phosphorylase
MMPGDKEYHIGIAPGEIPPIVLLPGDPSRAREIAETFFENPEEVAKKREFWSYRGTWKGTPVAVCSTGIGCPSAAIALEELVKVGCSRFIRVGTCGAISHKVKAGDLIIFTGAVRDDGTSRQYVPIEYPAVADPEVIAALAAKAAERGANYYMGVGHSKDAFYSEFPGYVADPDEMKRKWDAMRRAGILATEMESAALFVIGSLRGVKVGTVCVVVGENVEEEAKIEGKPPLDNLISVALDALVTLE